MFNYPAQMGHRAQWEAEGQDPKSGPQIHPCQFPWSAPEQNSGSAEPWSGPMAEILQREDDLPVLFSREKGRNPVAPGSAGPFLYWLYAHMGFQL